MKKLLKELLVTKNNLDAEKVLRLPSYDVAQEVKRFSIEDQIILLNTIPVLKSSKILQYMSAEEKYNILIHLSENKAKKLLNLQPIDELVDLLLAVHPEKQAKLMAYLDKITKHNVKKLMNFKPETAGSLVTSDFFAVRGNWSVKMTLKYIREHSENVESISYSYVLDSHGYLEGIVSIHELLLAADEEILSTIMVQEVISVQAEVDQQEVVKKLLNYNLAAIPVTTANNKMIGIITFDDVMSVMEAEATEDIQKLGGSEPLNQSYFEASIWSIFLKRLPWLLLLFVAEAYTGTVLKYFEDEIETVVALAFFVPLLVGTGGNTGTQVVATITRAIGIGEVKFKDIFRVMKKEFAIGMLLGLALGIAGLTRAYMLGVGTEVAQVVAITLLFIVIWASLVAAVLPLILRKLKLDPAVVSGPFITTFVDGTGLLIYFMVAKTLLNL
ncbi:magnesium transporter [Bacillus sp. CCB-MMP212]|uniref:magnesium transporter n=1 Tax=Bacillus TaxID=1386 RepID=UPI000B4ABA71|nr:MULTISPECIES: magnesium transporter [Bacillus]MBG9715095.1 magnesium transporter [Bacillus cereus]MCI4251376.1 magnesium transporter [Bacillus sp. CCB-MMP212]MDA2439580.1 magnesium transporter [Bacillus cereus]MDA2445841.1 magnesium transporter [Bacillus cereus]MDA2704657.1 magnesium transporter [Bacillus cereus]